MNKSLIYLFLCIFFISVSNGLKSYKVFDFTGYNPPDGALSVGPFSFISVVNGGIKISNKESGVIKSSMTLNQFFSKSNTYDPRSLYDNLYNRFIVITANGVTPRNSYVEIGISKDNDPNNLTNQNWYFFTINIALVQPNYWCDYPGLGQSDDNLFITCNLFSNTNVFYGVQYYVIPKEPFYNGIVGNIYSGFINGYSFMPANGNGNSNGNDKGGVLVSRLNSSQIRIMHLIGDNENIQMNNVINIPITSNILSDIPQLGSNFRVNTGDTRIQSCVYRNNNVWCVFASNVNNRGAINWYKFSNTGGIWTLNKSGIVSDPVLNYFRPCITVLSGDTFVIVFQGGNASVFPSVYSYNSETGVVSRLISGKGPIETGRYGDYTACQIDPVENSVWMLSETVTQFKNWETWVFKLEFEETCEKECIGGECIKKDSEWICECFNNYTGDLCELCIPNHYSSDCIKCNCGENEVCNEGFNKNGECQCLLPYIRDNNGNCVEEQDICKELDCGPGGECVKKYQRCLCAKGYYGSKCDKCPDCKNDSECNWGSLKDGRCLCKENFAGNLCEKCGEARYSKNCIMCPDCGMGICSNSINSEVPCICPIGYTGLQCEYCELGYIKENGKCIKENSVCDPICNTQGGKCNVSTKKCECKENYSGVACETCQIGYYSSFCLKCPDCGQFDNRGQCDPITGQCKCTASFGGKYCNDSLCDKPLYIPNDCKEGPDVLYKSRVGFLLKNYTDYYIIDSSTFNSSYTIFLENYLGEVNITYSINNLPLHPSNKHSIRTTNQSINNQSKYNEVILPKNINNNDTIYIGVTGIKERNSYKLEYNDPTQRSTIEILWFTWLMFVILGILCFFSMGCTVYICSRDSENGKSVVEMNVM